MDAALFGQHLLELRRSRGLTQADLAYRAHLTPQAVSLLEQGKRRPLLDTCQRLADALELSLSDLLAPLTTPCSGGPLHPLAE